MFGDLFVGFLVCAGEAGGVGQAGVGVVADRFHEGVAAYSDVAVADHVIRGEDCGVVGDEEFQGP